MIIAISFNSKKYIIECTWIVDEIISIFIINLLKLKAQDIFYRIYIFFKQFSKKTAKKKNSSSGSNE